MSEYAADALGGTVIGSVTEPGDDPNEFRFVAPDPESIRTGEFIAYEAPISGTPEQIVARVTNREQQRGFPETFMADPNVEPATVAGALGVPADDVDLYRMTARVIGYYDTQLDSFVNPRLLPRPGTRLHLAADRFLEAVLPNHDPGSDAGTAHLGWLLNRSPGATDIRLPIDEFAATHLAILASTGSGKSYTASVVLEEMLQPDSRAAVLVFDPHGEYTTLDQMAEAEHADVFRADDGYVPDVEIKRQRDISVRISDLSFADLLSVLDGPSDKMEATLRRAWERLGGERHVTIEDIITACEAVEDEESPTVNALRWRIRDALDRDIFHAARRLELDEILSPGQVTVLQLDGVARYDQQMLASVLLRKVYQEREKHERGRDSELPYPVFCLLEEGHRFAPDGSARSLGIIRTILSEGRKFGLGVGIISQRPSKIDADVLSQCGTQVIMQIQNPNDQKAIRQSVEAAGEDVLRELPGLTPGQAIVSGDAMNTPVLVRVRERHTDHGAESPEATSEWRAAWQQTASQVSGVRSPSGDDEDLETGPL